MPHESIAPIDGDDYTLDWHTGNVPPQTSTERVDALEARIAALEAIVHRLLNQDATEDDGR